MKVKKKYIEIKCNNPICDKTFTAWSSSKRKYCCHDCYTQNNKGDNNPMKREENQQKLRESLKDRIVTWGDKTSAGLKKSKKAQQYWFKKGKDNPSYGSDQSGEKNGNWKGGATKINQLLRNGQDYQEWRIACMERDGYKCTVCGCGGYLQVHHIKELAKYPDLRCDMDNGITVCIPCHNKIHGKKVGKLKKKKT